MTSKLRTMVEQLQRWATDRQRVCNLRQDPHGDLLSWHDVQRLVDAYERKQPDDFHHYADSVAAVEPPARLGKCEHWFTLITTGETWRASDIRATPCPWCEIERLRELEASKAICELTAWNKKLCDENDKLTHALRERSTQPPSDDWLGRIATILEMAKERESVFDMRSFVTDALTIIHDMRAETKNAPTWEDGPTRNPAVLNAVETSALQREYADDGSSGEYPWFKCTHGVDKTKHCFHCENDKQR